MKEETMKERVAHRRGLARVMALALALSMLLGLTPALRISAAAVGAEAPTADKPLEAAESADAPASLTPAETESVPVTESAPTQAAADETPAAESAPAEVAEMADTSVPASEPAVTVEGETPAEEPAEPKVTSEEPTDVVVDAKTWVIHGLDPKMSYNYRVKNADGWDASFEGADADGWICLPMIRDGVDDTRPGCKGLKMYEVARDYDIVEIEYCNRANYTIYASDLEKTDANTWTIHNLWYTNNFQYRVKSADGWDTAFPGADAEGWITLSSSDLVQDSKTSVNTRRMYTITRDYDIAAIEMHCFSTAPAYAVTTLSASRAVWTIHGLDPGQKYRYRVGKQTDSGTTSWDTSFAGVYGNGWIELPMGDAVDDTLAGSEGLKMYRVNRNYNIAEIEAHLNAPAATEAQLKAAEKTIVDGGSTNLLMMYAVGSKLYTWGDNWYVPAGVLKYNGIWVMNDTDYTYDSQAIFLDPIPSYFDFGADIVKMKHTYNQGTVALTAAGDVFAWGQYARPFGTGDWRNGPDNMFETRYKIPTKLDRSLVAGKLVDVAVGGNMIAAQDDRGNWYLAGAVCINDGENMTDLTGQILGVIDDSYCQKDGDCEKLKPISERFIDMLQPSYDAASGQVADPLECAGGANRVGVKKLIPSGPGMDPYGRDGDQGQLLVLTDDDRLFALGSNKNKTLLLPAGYTWQVGDAPVEVLELEQNQTLAAAGAIRQIECIGIYTYIYMEDGSVYRVGKNSSNSPVLFYDPAAYNGVKCVKIFSDFGGGQAMLLEDNTVYAWKNTYRQDATTAIGDWKQIFTDLSKEQTIVGLYPSSNQVIALTASGDLFYSGGVSRGSSGMGAAFAEQSIIYSVTQIKPLPVPTVEYVDRVMGAIQYRDQTVGSEDVAYERTETSLTFPDAINPSWPYGDPQWEYAIIPASDTTTDLTTLTYTPGIPEATAAEGAETGVTFTGLEPATGYNLVARRANDTNGVVAPVRSSKVAYTARVMTAEKAYLQSDGEQTDILATGEDGAKQTALTRDGAVTAENLADFTQVVTLKNNGTVPIYNITGTLEGDGADNFTTELIYKDSPVAVTIEKPKGWQMVIHGLNPNCLYKYHIFGAFGKFSETWTDWVDIPMSDAVDDTLAGNEGLKMYTVTKNESLDVIEVSAGIPAGETFNMAVKPKAGLANGAYNLNLTVSADDGTEIGFTAPNPFPVQALSTQLTLYGGRAGDATGTGDVVLKPANLKTDDTSVHRALKNTAIKLDVQWDGVAANSYEKAVTAGRAADPYVIEKGSEVTAAGISTDVAGDAIDANAAYLVLTQDINDLGLLSTVTPVFNRDESNYFYPQEAAPINFYVKASPTDVLLDGEGNPTAPKVQSEYTVVIPSDTDVEPLDLTGGIASATAAQTQALDGVTLGENGQVTIAKDTAKGGAAKFAVTVPASDEYEAAKIPVTVYLLEKQESKTLPDINLVVGKITSSKIELPAIEGATYEITDGGSLVTTGEITADEDGKHYVTLPENVTDAAKITITMTVPEKKGEGGEYKTGAVSTQQIVIRKPNENTSPVFVTKDKNGDFIISDLAPNANYDLTAQSQGAFTEDPKNYFVLRADETGKIVIKHDSEDFKTLELDQEGVDSVLIRQSMTDDTLPSNPLPVNRGVTVRGVANVFAPNREGRVMLYPYTEDGQAPAYYETHSEVFDTPYKCTFGGPDEAKSGGAEPVDFQIENVPAGTYLLVVVKPGSLHFVVENLVVGYENVDLTNASYPAEVQSMSLIPGDLNGNGKVETNDSAIIFRETNWGQNASHAEVEACDLNGNGLVETNDSAILVRTTNWGKSDTKVTLP